MAGSYVDVPGPRLAYDRDGSSGFYINTNGVISSMTTTDLQNINNENGAATDTNTGAVHNSYHGIIFSEKHDLVGLYYAGEIANGGVQRACLFQTSPDTTNGQDGTWTNLTTITRRSVVMPEPRTQITAVSASGVRGIRGRASVWEHANDGYFYWRAVHVYGTPSTGQAPNRLRFYHPTTASEVPGAYFDWGDTPRNAVVTKTFRVHNPSTLTAQDVTLTTEALTDTTPTTTSQHEFSIGGGAYATALNIGNLAPGATSAVVTVRRSVPSNATLGLWWARIVASAAAYV